MVAAEGLGELGGLAIADRLGGLRHRRALAQELCSTLHPHPAEVAAEAAVPALGEGALQLARRREKPPRNLIQGERVGVFERDDRRRLLEQISTPGCGCSTGGHGVLGCARLRLAT